MDLSTSIPVTIGVVGTGIMGMILWSVQRVVTRIDTLGNALGTLTTRVAVVESKQDLATEAAVNAASVGRRTAVQVGVDLPPELADTFDPRRDHGRR